MRRLLLIGTILLGAMAAGPAWAAPMDAAQPLGKVTKRSAAPLGYQLYCLKNKEQCRGGGAQQVKHSGQLLSKLKRVNSAVNNGMRFKNDKTDRWGKGSDCEDYALAKRKLLIREGVSPSALRMAVVRNSKGEGHAVLIVKTDRGEMVLDNARAKILPRHATGYTFLAVATSNPRKWSKF